MNMLQDSHSFQGNYGDAVLARLEEFTFGLSNQPILEQTDPEFRDPLKICLATETLDSLFLDRNDGTGLIPSLSELLRTAATQERELEVKILFPLLDRPPGGATGVDVVSWSFLPDPTNPHDPFHVQFNYEVAIILGGTSKHGVPTHMEGYHERLQSRAEAQVTFLKALNDLKGACPANVHLEAKNLITVPLGPPAYGPRNMLITETFFSSQALVSPSHMLIESTYSGIYGSHPGNSTTFDLLQFGYKWMWRFACPLPSVNETPSISEVRKFMEDTIELHLRYFNMEYRDGPDEDIPPEDR